MGKISRKISWELIKKTFLPVVVFVTLLGLYVFYRTTLFVSFPEKIQQELGKYIGTIFIVSISFIIQQIGRAALDWYGSCVATKTATKVDEELVPFLHHAFKIFVWVVTLLIILPLYGVNINALIATLGVSSLAIALAAQDTVSNIISGFMLMIDRPFRIGDKIKLPSGELVEVLSIGIRRTKFLSENKKEVIIMPNIDLSKSKIVNYTYAQET